MGIAKSEEARVGATVEWVEQLSLRNPGPGNRTKEAPLQRLDMRRDARRGQAVLRKRPPNGRESIECRGIEGRAEEARRVLSVADATGREGQVLELGEPARNPRAVPKAWRRMHERAPF